jgi:hypothetical protein
MQSFYVAHTENIFVTHHMYKVLTNEIYPIQEIITSNTKESSKNARKDLSPVAKMKNRDRDLVKKVKKDVVDTLCKKGNLSSTRFYWIAMTLPVILFTYIQLLFNLVMVLFVVYSMIKLKQVISADLVKHLEKQEYLILGKILDCSRDFIRNKCNSAFLPPALEGHCTSWKLCMEQDAQGSLKSAETASILAQILNSFFDSLSNRTIVCSGSILLGSILFANMVLTLGKRMSFHRKKK